VAGRVQGLTPWPGVTVSWQAQAGLAGAGVRRALILRRVTAEPGRAAEVGADTPAVPGQVLEGQHVAVRDGTIRLLEVQLPGGKPMTIDACVLGHRLRTGDLLIGAPAPA